jgi:hypothetical protein
MRARTREGSGCFRLVLASSVLVLILAAMWVFLLVRRVAGPP